MSRSLLWKGAGAGVVLALALAAAAAESGSDGWMHDFDQAETAAKRANLPLLVHFHAKWCGPCRHMEQTVFSDGALIQQLRTGFIAVKIDSDERPDLVQRFHIDRLPSDLFLDTNGYVLDRSSGAKDRETYRTLLARIDARFADSRASRIASQSRPLLTETKPPQRPTPPPAAPDPIRSRAVTSAPISVAIRPSIAASRPSGPVPPPTARRSWGGTGLRGFSPVALVTNRRWVRGEARFASDYKGFIYYMASSAELEQFRESPDRFAPQVLGCDPVILDITDRAVPGDIRFAAFFDDELYLFVSDKSRQAFKDDPERFVRTKHVLKVDELDDKRLE